MAGPLTRHLLFVVVDGLRYGVGTDPELMPEFARAMKGRRSAEIWCGRVSMTSSAVMSYGTGQPGRLEQIVRNVDPEPPPYESWIGHARRRGLTLMSVGDPAWKQMYGADLAESLVDPKGVAIDVDFNDQTFRDVRRLRQKQPNFLVAHFVTPDHQGHAYGILSQRYRRHIRDFDRRLHELLREFGPEWTVFVTSDHGAADSGTHGTDTPLQRRSPIYAYGPGIAPGPPSNERLQQNDVAGTLAALLGVEAPTHGVGHLLVDWLDVPAETAARIACNDAERALRYGIALLGAPAAGDARRAATACHSSEGPAAQTSAARRSVELVEQAVELSTGLGSRPAWFGAALCVLVAALAALSVLGRAALRALPAALALGAGAVLLTLQVERLPGSFPNVARAVLFTLGNAGALWVLLRPARAARWLERRSSFAPLLVPGLLVVTYTPVTQVQSYVVLCLGALVLWLPGRLDASGAISLRSFGRELTRPRALVLLVALLALAPAGTVQKQIPPDLLYKQPELALAAALILIVLWAASHAKRGAPLLVVVVVAVAVVASLLSKRVVSPFLGRTAILVFAATALAVLWRGPRQGRTLLAVGLGVASYAWVSRDVEFLVLIPTLFVAELLAARRTSVATGAGPLPFVELLLWVAVTFALLYVQRLGIQGSLDLGGMDWNAGGFHDPNVPAWLVGSAIVYKYLVAQLLVIGILFGGLSPSARDRVFEALTLAYFGRGAILLAILFVCGSSFWTGLRVLGDIPFALIGGVATLVVWIGARLLTPRPFPNGSALPARDAAGS